MATDIAVRVDKLRHRYRSATTDSLRGIDLEIKQGALFGLLGPNGSGKSTLFKILSTLFVPTSGSVSLFGSSAIEQPFVAREFIGVVFQHPSLDKKLSVEENLYYQGKMYGLAGVQLTERIDELISRFGLEEKRTSRADSLSGGQMRRAEIAKGILHKPRLLILDEPSTGLDPRARAALWDTLRELRQDGVTILVTTHLMTEAELCSELAILDSGSIVAKGTAEELKNSIGGDVITVTGSNPEKLQGMIKEDYGIDSAIVSEKVRFELEDGHTIVSELVEKYKPLISGISYGKPTLEDVFIRLSGHAFYEDGQVSA